MATSILSVRVSPIERAMLERVAKRGRTNVSDFVRRKAMEAAELELMQPADIVIPAEKWAAFEAWLAEPPAPNPDLERLAKTKPVWED
jgi:uncharacterized protein (DUF1778 family)